MEMRNMSFDVDVVRNCLIENGCVFSVRSYCLENENVKVEGVGVCRRINGFEVKSKDDLVKYVKRSGFESVDDWWNVIERVCRGKRKWMYMVKISEGSIESSTPQSLSPSFIQFFNQRFHRVEGVRK